MATTDPGSVRAPLPGTVRVLSAFAVAVLVIGGGWVAGGVVTNDFGLAMLLTAVWVGAVGLVCLLLFLRRREMWPVLAVFVLTAGAAGGYLAMETLVDDRVNEDVVTASRAGDGGTGGGGREKQGGGGADPNVLLASGGFSSLEHTTSGDVEWIDVADGRAVLTLTAFETDPGPDLRLYLSSPDAGTGSAGEQYVDLGALKGNVGDQQYEIPPDAELDRLSKVLVWCRAFSVGFGEAQLEPARGGGNGSKGSAA